MVKICFWDNGLSERGTTVSLFHYAHYNEIILGNESFIMFETNHYSNKDTVIKMFKNRFKVYIVDNWNKVDKILLDEKCDILYITKHGSWDGKISNVCKTVVHSVFSCAQPHGNVYSSISPWVHENNGRYPVVPHIVDLPSHNRNMREKLNIPENATVFGRHGGLEQFDISYVQNTVYDVAKNNKNIYFLFVNTLPFCESLPNIIHLPVIVNVDEKTEFINTCDAMIWGRSGGETFGLAIAEFSIRNKPVLCCISEIDNAHVYLLKDKAFWYDEATLKNILLCFNRQMIMNKEVITKHDWNAYREYSPEKVMKIFKEVYIDN